ncbi:MAG: protein-L-isoaspartate(D-aspartate) O-methyltransferase [Bdellovibrionota bacterium]
MVEKQIIARGIHSSSVISAMQTVPREEFLPDESRNAAYRDQPVPIGHGQTISQPYMVAYMLELLDLKPTDTVLEIGVGSGYASAVLSRIVMQVYGIEWHAELAERAARHMKQLRYGNVVIETGDGSRGWPEHAPYNAILVSAAGWTVPEELREQLNVGGKLIIPVGEKCDTQKLLLVERIGETEFHQKEYGSVRFVPLVGRGGWDSGLAPYVKNGTAVSKLLREEAISFSDIHECDLSGLLDRIQDSRVVLIGEATHGTSEFYAMRARITQALIEQKGFSIVAIEGDWPDAFHINSFLHGRKPIEREGFIPFHRFPLWMWRNLETAHFLSWLREYNALRRDEEKRVHFAGLDIYSLYCSMEAVLTTLEQINPDVACTVREEYGCLSPWKGDPGSYGRAVLSGAHEDCEQEVLSVLRELLHRRMDMCIGENGNSDLMNVIQNARVVVNAEEYYRTMYYSSTSSWNLRDQHMFDTLLQLLDMHGSESRAVVWAHNSHIGDASATEMSRRGELNIGQLCREHFLEEAYNIGFGLNGGVVAAASRWGGTMERKRVRPALEHSYEGLCHRSQVPAFFLPLRCPAREEVRHELLEPRLERAIGVIYRPESERISHYFQATLPKQFDEYIWFDTTKSVVPLPPIVPYGPPDTFPFGI